MRGLFWFTSFFLYWVVSIWLKYIDNIDAFSLWKKGTNQWQCKHSRTMNCMHQGEIRTIDLCSSKMQHSYSYQQIIEKKENKTMIAMLHQQQQRQRLYVHTYIKVKCFDSRYILGLKSYTRLGMTKSGHISYMISVCVCVRCTAVINDNISVQQWASLRMGTRMHSTQVFVIRFGCHIYFVYQIIV